jgi:hypothetical protein
VEWTDIKPPGKSGNSTKTWLLLHKPLMLYPATWKRHLRLGCDDYISKPIKKVEMAGLLQKYFNELENGKSNLQLKWCGKIS